MWIHTESKSEKEVCCWQMEAKTRKILLACSDKQNKRVADSGGKSKEEVKERRGANVHTTEGQKNE